MADNTSPLTNAASDDTRRVLVERVIESRYFSKSARLRDMLLYVSDRVLREGVTEIHEQEVGHRVFGREPDYDTASDNAVRVHASTLRKRLEQFFAAEGADEPVTIELPKGNYAPVFRERVATPVAAEAMHVAGPDTLEAMEEDPAVSMPRTGTRWVQTVLVVLVALFGTTTIWLLSSRTSAPKSLALAGKPTVQQFWAGIFPRGQTTDLVLDDAAIGLYQELTGRTIGLSDYYDRGYLRGLDAPGAGSKLDRDVAGQLIIRRQSSFANINVLWRLNEVASAAGGEAKPVFARDYSFQSLKSNSAVLLGNSRTNPWAEPFESAIGVHWQFDPAHSGYFPVDTWAASASRDQFRQTSDKREGQDSFALAILLPNLCGSGQVLLLSATGGSALGVAADFLTDEAAVGRLRSRLLPAGQGNGAAFPSFEALLRIRSRSRRPEDVALVVCRTVTARVSEAPK